MLEKAVRICQAVRPSLLIEDLLGPAQPPRRIFGNGPAGVGRELPPWQEVAAGSTAASSSLPAHQSKSSQRSTIRPSKLLLFSVLFGLFIVNLLAFNGDICRDLASRFPALAEKQRTPFH
jgi:hypothetical protein